MKITEKLIIEIYNLKKKLTSKKNKIILSKYQDFIPLYDIYDNKIVYIQKDKIFFAITQDLRFISKELLKWIKNKLKKSKKGSIDYKNNKKILMILDNYDIETLEKTSYSVLYEYTPELGMNFSICKKNSFHKYMQHSKPYYSYIELIKLGKNNKILRDNITEYSLIDRKTHYQICKKISKNDIPSEVIIEHMNIIFKNNCISLITDYSLINSYLYNNYLRNNTTITEKNYNNLKKIAQTINKTNKFVKDYYFYRLNWDDKFLNNLKIGDTFIEKGFLSTTRNPFYSPGIENNFGLILVKIKIPKNMKGVGIFIENYSLFPKEEEFIFHPHSKFKLVSRDNNFKYYHVNQEFEDKINKKYEFVYLGKDENFLSKYKFNNINIPTIDLNLKLKGGNRIELFKNFTKYTNSQKQFKINNVIMEYNFFNSLESYQDYYYNKVKVGINFVHKDDNGYPILSIECGEEFVINFMQTYYYYDNEKPKFKGDLKKITSEFGRLFKYKKAIIFPDFFNYMNYVKEDTIFRTNKLTHYNLKKKELLDDFNIEVDNLNYDLLSKNILNIFNIEKYLNIKINDDITYEEQPSISDEYNTIFSNDRRRIR